MIALGLDLGTSGLRGLLIDDDQRVIAEAEAPLSVTRPHPGWSEQDPDAWIAACENVITQLRREPAFASLGAIGLSGQMHGATMVSGAGKALRPCLLWNDTRAHAQAATMDADPRFRAISGNIVFPGFTAPKVAWVREHEPDVFAATRHILLPKDYLRLWLTGEAVSDMSDAAGTSWLDVAARDWSDDLLAACGLSRDHMPRLVEGSAAGGMVREALLRDWGLSAPVTVAGGGGDNAASACGIGAVAPGSGFVSLGTSGVLFVSNDAYRPKPESAVHAFCHALPDTWHQMGVILSATDGLNWLAGVLGQPVAEMAARVAPDARGPAPVTFLPYLSGERTPHNDSHIRGAFVGLDIAQGAGTLVQAVMEGVGFALRDNLEALRSTGAAIDSLMAVGGGARSGFWLRTLATQLGMPITLPAKGEFGAAMGAARLGLTAAGADPAMVMTPPPVSRTIEPDAARQDAYEAAYRRYRALYPALKSATQEGA